MERRGRKTSERQRSGERDFRKREEWERSERSGNGNGAVSGSPVNWWSVERHFSPLLLCSHALIEEWYLFFLLLNQCSIVNYNYNYN
jgi:hypothetical protein